MLHPTLFYVAPEIVHLAAHYDGPTNTWTVRVARSTRGRDGDLRCEETERYEFLTAAEAADVIAAASRTLLEGPLNAGGDAAGC